VDILGHRFKAGEHPTSAEIKAYLAAMRADMHVRAEHQLLHNEFMRDLAAGKLSLETLQLFWLNWSSYVAEINGIIQCAYQKHIGFFKKNVDLMGFFADKIADELIHPKPPGHILVVWEQGEILGLSRDDMTNYPMLSECRAFLEWFRGTLHEGTIAEFWSMIVLEEYTGYWARDFRLGLESMGYARETQAPYFHTHEEADLVEHQGVMAHGEFNWAVLERLLTQGYTDFRPGFTPHYVMCTSIDLFETFHNAVSKAAKQRAGSLSAT
jgi:pyrroloquinoline quinone (PQQ) biosynthesis protein C